MVEMPNETVFTWGAPPIKFGAGAVDELGWDLLQLGVERVVADGPFGRLRLAHESG